MAALFTQAQAGDAGPGGGGDVTGAVMVYRASVPVIGSWPSRWTCSRRRLAEKPISRSAGRLVSRLPIPKSVVSLTAVSVRNALPSLWLLLDPGCL